MGGCMKKRGLNAFLSIFLLIILAGIFSVIMICTNEKLEKREPSIYKSLDDFKTTKVTEAYKTMISKADKKVQLVIDEQELNDLTAIVIQDYEKNADAIDISGYSAQINTDSITIRLDSKLFELLSTQYVLKIKPSIVDKKLNMFVSEFKVGKFPLSPKTFLKQIQTSDKSNYYVDLEQQSIVIENKYPEQMIFNDIKLEQGKVSMEFALSIKNVKDLMKILGTLLPEGLKQP